MRIVFLFLFLAVFIAGCATPIFNKQVQDASKNAEENLSQQLMAQGQRVAIIMADATTVTMRASGTQSITPGTISILVNNSLATQGNCPATQQAAGAAFTCTSTVAVCNGNADQATKTRISVNAPGNTDATTC